MCCGVFRAQVVGWPPIRSYRKNTMASSTSKNTNEVGLGPLFVKVSMDGAPYLRKVDLRTYTCYQHLSSALEKMFSCFTLGEFKSKTLYYKEMKQEQWVFFCLVCGLRSMWASWSSWEGKNEWGEAEGSSSWIRVCAYLWR